MINIRLKELIENKGITQAELAKATNIRQATISSYCNNNFKRISQENIDKLCKYFNCDVSDLIEKRELSNPYEVEDLIKPAIIDHFNLLMKSKGSSIRIVPNGEDLGFKRYKLTIVDIYIDNDYLNIPVTKECEEMVRNFFNGYGIELPFTNSIIDIYAYRFTKASKDKLIEEITEKDWE